MPAGVDEDLWEKAKKIAEDQGHKEDWAYVRAIYEKLVKARKNE